MIDTTRDSDRIISAAGQSLAEQRAGGTHRRAKSIGKGSADAKAKAFAQRIVLMAGAVAAIILGGAIYGLVINPLGFAGVMAVVILSIIALGVFSQFPKASVPKRADLKKGNPKQMVARTELWLEAQRSGLPLPAAEIVDRLGVQLDALGVQLEAMDQSHPAMAEVRELVGEYIPETIANYRKVPAQMRSEAHAGKTADERLIDSLTRLSGEVDRVTRRLAEGALDDLAVKSRYLEYRYGEDAMLTDMRGDPATEGVPLPPPAIPTPSVTTPEKTKAPR
ncbi:MAG: hypothetical protein V2J51_05085 [Erythrobacter sp.]|jgi:hypothetical protein|nr:hypothetical protein [Erythrobacter sp.]